MKVEVWVKVRVEAPDVEYARRTVEHYVTETVDSQIEGPRPGDVVLVEAVEYVTAIEGS